MRRVFSRCIFAAFFFAAAAVAFSQNDHKVITVTDAGTISGMVK